MLLPSSLSFPGGGVRTRTGKPLQAQRLWPRPSPTGTSAHRHWPNPQFCQGHRPRGEYFMD